MKCRHFLFISILFLFSNSAISQKNKEYIQEMIMHDGLERTFLIHLPESFNHSKPYPLVIALHGGNGRAKRFNKSTRYRFNNLADEEGFIVVYPQGIDRSWNDHPDRNSYGTARTENVDDVGFISSMIDHLIENYPVNPQFVFACGISNGGLMSATLAVKLPDRIKAIGMVAANFSKVFLNEVSLNPPAPFPMIIIHGTEDPIFPYEEGFIAIFKQNRGAVAGVEKSISFLLGLNGNSTSGVEAQLPDPVLKDKCKTIRIEYPNLENPMMKIELLKVIGGGHTWPGGHQYLPRNLIGRVTKDFNAADELWRFFKSTMAP
jgi:polyhydroxybutyrate depolymerase